MNVSFCGDVDRSSFDRALVENMLCKILDRYPDTIFYMGVENPFDMLCYDVLTFLKRKYPDLQRVLLTIDFPYRPAGDVILTISPQQRQFENTLDNRNRWLLKNANYVVAYVNGSYEKCMLLRFLVQQKIPFVNLGSWKEEK